MSTLPFPDRENRSLSMRDQVIARLRQISPFVYRDEYVAGLKDFALLQALEIAIWSHLDKQAEEHAREMFDAGMDYERQNIINQLSERA